jgi:hypothetical protein
MKRGSKCSTRAVFPRGLAPIGLPFLWICMDHFSELVELDGVNEQVGLGWSVTGTDLNQPLF